MRGEQGAVSSAPSRWSVQICGHLTNIIRGDRLSIVQRQVRNIYLPVSSDQLIFVFRFSLFAFLRFFPLSLFLAINLHALFVCVCVLRRSLPRSGDVGLPSCHRLQCSSPAVPVQSRCVPFQAVLESTNCLSNTPPPIHPFTRSKSVRQFVSPSVSQSTAKQNRLHSSDLTSSCGPFVVLESLGGSWSAFTSSSIPHLA